MEGFNWELCQDRHRKIEKVEVEVFKRIKSLENGRIFVMGILVMNLLGVVAILITK